MAVAQKSGTLVNGRLKPAVCPSSLILSHTHISPGPPERLGERPPIFVCFCRLVLGEGGPG